MSHEQTITFDMDGKFFNVPTVVDGKKVSGKKAIDFAIKNKKLGRGFTSLQNAEKAAKARSKSFDNKPKTKKSK
jgi:hypothetical protein